MLVSVVVILAAPTLFTIALIILGPLMRGDEDWVIPVSVLCGLVPTGIAWWRVWVHEVRWTKQRVNATFLMLAAVVFISLVVGIFVMFAAQYDREGPLFGFLVGGMSAWLLWFGGTPLVWRESARERADRLRGHDIHGVHCPACGYSLTGLREARCPECGAQYTIDQLVAEVLEQRGGVPE